MTSVLSLLFLPETITDDNIYDAAELWFNGRVTAETTFGPMEEWDMSDVTTLLRLFCGNPVCPSSAYYKHAQSFNHDISRWDVSGVIGMQGGERRNL